LWYAVSQPWPQMSLLKDIPETDSSDATIATSLEVGTIQGKETCIRMERRKTTEPIESIE
jgi:hypothetical protein